MQGANVYLRVSDAVHQWFSRTLYRNNIVIPSLVLSNRPQKKEAVRALEMMVMAEAVTKSSETFDCSIELQINTEPVISLCGILDESNYLVLIGYAQSVYEQGYRQITLDLSRCTNVKLSGLFALVSILTLFRGEALPDPRDGFSGLRQMIGQIRDVDSTDEVLFKNATGNVKRILMKNGLLPSG